ncbi:MAG: uroporphyrinogen-III C-methyltransferase [Deltaproteobacteria bacterium]|nr:uroporphyrinogen-III C-methyltransferase [Deltaproteobacteria bacterium]
MTKGKVYLIGAGPGDPDLLTLKGLTCIKEADVIVYDYLANERFLDYGRDGVEVIYVGKKGGGHTLSQDEINKLLVEKARKGKVVARLKGGDPFIFGRGGEEAEVLVEAGIPFEVVSGVTSAIAAPTYAGIPLTHRDFTSTVAFITGHEDPTKEESSIAWDKISTGAGTLVFLMGVKNLSSNVEKLIANGRDPETPVALIRWGTTPEQETVVGRLDNIVELARQKGLRPPVVMVVGDVVSLRERLNWFETRPLFGKKVIVTRAREQASEFSRLLEKYGAEVVEFPTIEIQPPRSWKELNKVVKRIGTYDWVIFTSVNGVRYLVERLKKVGRDIRDLKGVRICAIGPATARAIEDLGIKVDLTPKEYRAEAVLQGLGRRRIKGKRFLLPRALKARELLPEEIRRLGGRVDVVTAYRTVRPKGKVDEVRRLLEERKVDVVTFSSSSTVTNFVTMFKKGEIPSLLDGVAVACIGPITRDTAAGFGIKTNIMPGRYTIPALTEAIVELF